MTETMIAGLALALDELKPVVLVSLPMGAKAHVLCVDFTCDDVEVTFEAASVSYLDGETTKHVALRGIACETAHAFAAAMIDSAGFDSTADTGQGSVVIDFSEQTVEMSYAEEISETRHRDFSTLSFDAIRMGARPVETDPLEHTTTETQRQMLMAQWVKALGPVRDTASLTAAFSAVVDVLTSDQMEQVIRRTRGARVAVAEGGPDGD